MDTLQELKVRLTLDNVSLKPGEQEDLQSLLDRATNPISASTLKALEDMDRGGKLLVKMANTVQKLTSKSQEIEQKYENDLSLLSQLLAAIAEKQPVNKVKALLGRLESEVHTK